MLGRSSFERTLAWGARDKEREYQQRVRRERRDRQRQEQRPARSFPPDNGTVNGQPAYVQQADPRIVAYYGEGHEGKIVTNDGINASYVRDPNGYVVLDYHPTEEGHNPYEGYFR